MGKCEILLETMYQNYNSNPLFLENTLKYHFHQIVITGQMQVSIYLDLSLDFIISNFKTPGILMIPKVIYSEDILEQTRRKYAGTVTVERKLQLNGS